MTISSDKIYSQARDGSPFEFDQQVANVFPDMIKRSVPGYAQIIDNIQHLAKQFISKNSRCFDLGCSLGAASLAMSYGNNQPDVEIIGIDSSAPMLKRCQDKIDSFKHKTPIRLLKQDINETQITNASMVVLNFTLQFIAFEQRSKLLSQIFEGLNQGGVLILSEKVVFSDQKLNQLMIELHHQFKRSNGYSDLEISQKRNALENVLIPETRSKHIQRLKDIGFSHVSCWHQQLNFASFIAIKS